MYFDFYVIKLPTFKWLIKIKYEIKLVGSKSFIKKIKCHNNCLLIYNVTYWPTHSIFKIKKTLRQFFLYMNIHVTYTYNNYKQIKKLNRFYSSKIKLST